MLRSTKKAPKTLPNPTDSQKILRPDEPPVVNQKQPEFDRLIIPKRVKSFRLPENIESNNYYFIFYLFFIDTLLKIIFKHINIYTPTKPLYKYRL